MFYPILLVWKGTPLDKLKLVLKAHYYLPILVQ